ncbi:MAG: right-handed parallel beta-helix repeat-containing protein [Phycisphaerae bacterium]
MRTMVLVVLAACVSPACPAAEIHVDAASSAARPDGSEAAPYRTVTDGLKTAGPGDTVVVHAGLYRESVRVPGGEAGRPVTLMAAEGERAVLSGAVAVTGWKAKGDGAYTATLDFRPDRLLLGRRTLPVARMPDDGWWRAEQAEGTTLTDKDHLADLPFDPAGGQVYLWAGHGNTFFTATVESLDRKAGRLTVNRPSKWMTLNDGDLYYLKHHPALVRRPGEWCVQPDGEVFRITYKPARKADLDRVAAPKEIRRVVLVAEPGHVRIEGLEVAGAAKDGIYVTKCEDVVVTRCIARDNGRSGIGLRDARNVTVRRNLVVRNYTGVSLHGIRGGVVEQNEIARNGMDGLIVSWGSDDVTVRRNAIHHHLLWGHPDNMQMYRGVTNIRIVDNLLLAGGQAIMMEETSDGLMQGNMIVGSGATAVIFGHENARDWRIVGNTIAFGGYGCLRMTADDYEVRENVFVTGTPGFLYGVRGVKGYEGDRNLLFNAPGLEKAGVVSSDAGWHGSFEAYRKATGYEPHSVYAPPRFRHAPVAYGVLDHRRLTECTRRVLHLREKSGPVSKGDTVEIDFDGVPRTVTAAEGATITVDPPLPARPTKGCLVCNWGKEKDLQLDLRLADDSPGADLAADGGPVGSRIDIAAYQRGDFDGDGKRDVPQEPPAGEKP